MDARRQALNYAFAIKAGLGVEMSVGRRMLSVFERRPGLLHALITGFRPAWKAFADITRGVTSLGGLVRTHPLARRALDVLDRQQAGAARSTEKGGREPAREDEERDKDRKDGAVTP